MKHFIVAATFLIVFVGCNESKESRIRKLESQVEQTNEKIQEFETRLLSLEANAE
jgi:hypothetical protein